MTDKEIKEFQEYVGEGTIQLFGYSSTSTSYNQAMSFAWQDDTTGHKKVLFQIHWGRDYDHYYLDAGAYDYEQEIVLYDGAKLYVLEVREILNDEDVHQHTLIVLASKKY